MEQIQLQLIIDTAQSAKSVGEAKKALRDIQGELLNIKDTGSKEFRELAAVAGDLKDRIGDAKDAIAAFTPEGKFAAIANAASGIASGFQAAQGAMALFGGESKEVEKVLLKVQAATAVAQGLQGVAGLGDAMGNMRNVLKSVVSGLGTLRGALIATGIGAIAVAVGTLAANWDTFTKFIDKSFPSLGGVANLFDNIKKVAMGTVSSIVEGFKVVGDVLSNIFSGEFSKAFDTAKTFGSRVSQAYNEGFKEEEEAQAEQRKHDQAKIANEDLARRIKLEEAAGKDVYNIKRKWLKAETELIKFEKGEQSKEYKDSLLAIRVHELEHQKELEKQRAEQAAKAAEAKAWMKEVAMNDAKEAEATDIKNEEALKKILSDAAAEKTKTADEAHKQIQAGDKAAHDARISINQSIAENDKLLLQQKLANRNAELQLAAEVVNGLSQIGNIFIKDGEKNKKFQQRLALAQLAVDSGKALASAVAFSAANPSNAATFGIAGAIQYASAAGAILANIAKARQIIKGADSGTPPALGGATTPKTSVSLPSVPSLSNARNNGGGVSAPQQQQAQVYNQAIKVYVTETDITNSQKRVGTIEQRATIK